MKSHASWSPTTTSMPSGSARVSSTAIVCGWHRSERKKHFPSAALSNARAHNVIASAAAVASSRSDALATSSPVSDITSVWKFKSASRRPWAISA